MYRRYFKNKKKFTGTKQSIRGFIIGPTLMAVSQFSGTFTISNYASIIFKASGSTIEPNMSAIVMGSVQVLGTCCASILIDKLGRKVLLLMWTAGSTIALLITGTYTYMGSVGYDVSAFNILPVVAISAMIFVSAIGIIPVPYVLVNEIFSRKVSIFFFNLERNVRGLNLSVFFRFVKLLQLYVPVQLAYLLL